LVPGDSSKLCLSCHDGSVAIDNFLGTGGNPNSTNKIASGNSRNLGTNLSNDHPIGVLYTDTSHDSSYNKPSTTTVVLGETGTNTKTVKVADLLSSEGKVECASCHDVHNTFVVSLPGMLKVSNLASAPATKQLCAACHNK
jgi:cytochrome c peroxidase